MTIENNFFAKTSIGFYNGQFARGYANCTNFSLKNNVMEQGWVFDCPSSNGAADPSVSNNYWIGEAPPGCGSVGTWRANIFDTAPQRPCDSAQKIVKTATQMGLKGSDARRGLTKARFLCGSQAEGALVSVAGVPAACEAGHLSGFARCGPLRQAAIPEDDRRPALGEHGPSARDTDTGCSRGSWRECQASVPRRGIRREVAWAGPPCRRQVRHDTRPPLRRRSHMDSPAVSRVAQPSR